MNRDITKIAILGAGPAGLATAWALSAPEQRERFEITLYQPGWQAGGLCSTGRVTPQMWVNQNGTHYLFGAYVNSFQLCRQAYDELARAGHEQFGRFEEQFVHRDRVVLEQFFDGRWTQWPIEFPTNLRRPGEGIARPQPADLAGMLLQWLFHAVAGAEGLDRMHECGVFPEYGDQVPRWRRRLSRLSAPLVDGGVRAAVVALGRARDVWRTSGPDLEGPRAGLVLALEGLRRVLAAVLGDRVDTRLFARRLWILADLAISVTRGLLADRALRRDGYAGVDALDLREWLTRWGASALAVESPVITAWYNAIAGYEGGDVRRPNVSAGVSLGCLSHLMLGYSGSFAYQIVWGIGDSFIAPIYRALALRGVRFAFFHRVWDLVPDPTGSRIESIELERQVDLVEGDPLGYRPLVPHDERPVWPDQPDWSQVTGGDPGGPRLDSFYAPRRGATVELRAGRDFDAVVSAMGSATYRYYARGLIEQKARWRAIVERLQTVETQSLRLWFTDELPQLGWTHGPPIVSGFAQPFATWEDPTPLLETERWAVPPRTLAHLFGPLPHPRVYPEPDEDPDYEARQQQHAERDAGAWLDHALGHLWPGAADPSRPPALDPDRLVHRQIRANPGPVQAYTMITAGSLAHRPRAEDSGYDNLVLAGDWTRNGFDVGSFEGAVLSGWWASRALSGFPERIDGAPLPRGGGLEGGAST